MFRLQGSILSDWPTQQYNLQVLSRCNEGSAAGMLSSGTMCLMIAIAIPGCAHVCLSGKAGRNSGMCFGGSCMPSIRLIFPGVELCNVLASTTEDRV